MEQKTEATNSPIAPFNSPSSSYTAQQEKPSDFSSSLKDPHHPHFSPPSFADLLLPLPLPLHRQSQRQPLQPQSRLILIAQPPNLTDLHAPRPKGSQCVAEGGLELDKKRKLVCFLHSVYSPFIVVVLAVSSGVVVPTREGEGKGSDAPREGRRLPGMAW